MTNEIEKHYALSRVTSRRKTQKGEQEIPTEYL